MARRRHHLKTEDKAEVSMSPLIDCVFLLLIFFLVTTMLKKKEMQIPIELPQADSMLAEQADEEVLIVGLGEEGDFYRLAGQDSSLGQPVYAPIDDLASYLQEVAVENGPAVYEQLLRIDADRMTGFQTTIDAIDICKLQGFTNVTVKLRDTDPR